MYFKLLLVLLIIVLAAAIVGFDLLPGISVEAEGVARIVFFVFLVPLIISLFDVVGRTFRRF
jgi:uncharacterized membrane protein YtjA (UPF0391 family)